MTYVYIVCSDRIFRRMLCLELSECGANVMPEKSTPVPPCALLISAPDAGSVTIPDGDCLSVVFGYAEELSDIGGLDPTAVLSRPFDTDELMRVLFGDSGSSSSPTIRKITATGRLSVDKEKRTVVYHGSSSRLTKREFALFEYLYSRRGTEVSRSELYDNVWGGGDGENVVDVYICYLREKLENKFGIKLIRTVRGKGYMFEE